jgi:hypothetical protein
MEMKKKRIKRVTLEGRTVTRSYGDGVIFTAVVDGVDLASSLDVVVATAVALPFFGGITPL